MSMMMQPDDRRMYNSILKLDSGEEVRAPVSLDPPCGVSIAPDPSWLEAEFQRWYGQTHGGEGYKNIQYSHHIKVLQVPPAERNSGAHCMKAGISMHGPPYASSMLPLATDQHHSHQLGWQPRGMYGVEVNPGCDCSLAYDLRAAEQQHRKLSAAAAAASASATRDFVSTSYPKTAGGADIQHWQMAYSAEDIANFYASPVRVMYEGLNGENIQAAKRRIGQETGIMDVFRRMN
jgi:hypothetical protein